MKTLSCLGTSPQRILIRTLMVLSAAALLAGCHRKGEAAPATANPTAPETVAANVAAPTPDVPPAPAAVPSDPAAPSAAPTATAMSQFNWPRTYKDGTTTLMVYQPAIEKWDGYNFKARFAVSIQEANQPAPAFGVIWLTATTNVDKDEGVVTLTNLAIVKSNFPTEPDNAQKYTAYLSAQLPAQSLPIPLAQISNRFQLTKVLNQVAAQPVKNTPPRIFFSDQPALLVLVDGDPVMRPLAGTNCNRVFNTSSLIVQNAADGGPYYLRALGYWYKSDAVAGPWTVDPDAPARLASVDQAAQAIPQIDLIKPPASGQPPAPDIYVSTVPAELVQTQGQASFVPIDGTSLLEVKNSDTAIILSINDQHFYVLISGRWFSSTALTGQPWAFVPGDKLPADFAKIPPTSDKSNVLVSVPGTPEAQEAVIANSIPQSATVNRQQASLTVTYDGVPQFVPVSGTSLQYALNTASPVIEVNPTSFYSVSNGVWFNAPAPVGPWAVATSVPPVIYTIPVASPIHYVTYVQVYGYTDSVVYVGYTPGYYGTVVTPGGTVVYGSGYAYPPYVGTTVYVAPPPTYGYGAGFAYAPATGFLFGFAAGAALGYYTEPHWGCWGTGNTYNTTINSGNCYNSWGAHTVTTAPAYGYHNGGYAAAGYNPYNGNWAAASKSGGYNSSTGAYSGQRSAAGYNASTGNYAAGQQKAGYNPNTGTAAAGERGISGNTETGNYNAGREGGAANAQTGRSASGQTSVSGNAYNGNWNANQSRSYNDSQTGASASSSKTASGNAQDGTASSQTDRSATSANGSTASSTVDKSTGQPTTRSGTTYNAKTGQSNSYDHTTGQGAQNEQSEKSSTPSHAYSSSDGNVYKPSSSSSSGYQKSTSNGWQDSSHNESQQAHQQSQSWGNHSSDSSRDRSSSGGGGDRWGGSGDGGSRWGGGGDRSGGGESRGGGGFSRGGGGRGFR